jgi:hypothetical protein
MHPTQQPTADRSETPAAVLRHAAIYLWRYGWIKAAFYHQPDPDLELPFPPACAVGAIRAAVFGRPMDALYDTAGSQLDDPDHNGLVDQCIAAQQVLAKEVDPEFDPDVSVTLDVIADWNDTAERTIADVLIALYCAADDWDAAHPLHHKDSTQRVGGGKS